MTFSTRIRRNIALSLLVVFALGLALLVSVRGAAHASSPAITLSSTFGPPTTPVTVNGTGFGAVENITIFFQGN